MAKAENILVIKLGALGDFIQAMGPMAAIRDHHPDANIILLTTQAFYSLAQQCGYFNEIFIDKRPKWHDIKNWIALRNFFNTHMFSRIYDLQNNDRTSFYFRLINHPKPEWVGIAKGASHRNPDPTRTKGHAFDGHVQTLALAGVMNVRADDLKWAQADISDYNIKGPYILLIPGSASSKLYKRWPAKYYQELGATLEKMGFQILILGGKEEANESAIISKSLKNGINLVGRTNLFQIATLARGAKAAIGNDTGPMHLIAATKCPCLVLFSGHTNPSRHAPKGSNVHFIQKDNLIDLSPEDVFQTIKTAEILIEN